MSQQGYGLHKLTGGIAKRDRDAREHIAQGGECHLRQCHEPAEALVQNALGQLFLACRAHADRGRELGYTVLEGD